MPHAAALAGEDHLILVLDEVHAARVRVDEQRAVTAAPATAAAWLRHDDVGHAFRVGPGRLRRGRTAAAAASTAAAPAAGGHAGQQLRGRYRRARARRSFPRRQDRYEPSRLRGANSRRRRRLRTGNDGAASRQQERGEDKNPVSHARYSFAIARPAGLRDPRRDPGTSRAPRHRDRRAAIAAARRSPAAGDTDTRTSAACGRPSGSVQVNVTDSSAPSFNSRYRSTSRDFSVRYPPPGMAVIPCCAVEADRVDHQRVPLPMRDGIAIGRGVEDVLADVRRSVRVEIARRRRVLGHDDDRRRALPDVERAPGIHHEGHAEQVAPANRRRRRPWRARRSSPA